MLIAFSVVVNEKPSPKEFLSDIFQLEVLHVMFSYLVVKRR